MAAPNKLVVGLGNPGAEYERTRHNIGWRVLEAMRPLEWHDQDKFQADVARDGATLYVKPLTYMNESGVAVRALVDYYKIAPGDVLVVVDDADLPFGELRLRPNGSSAGQRGLESIISHLGTADIPRLRVGIGRDDRMDLTSYVLSAFTSEEEEQLSDVIKTTLARIGQWIESGNE